MSWDRPTIAAEGAQRISASSVLLSIRRSLHAVGAGGRRFALLPAARLFNNLTQIVRLCLDGPFEPAKAPEGLKTLLAQSGEVPDFARLEADLAVREAEVAALFAELIA